MSRAKKRRLSKKIHAYNKCELKTKKPKTKPEDQNPKNKNPKTKEDHNLKPETKT